MDSSTYNHSMAPSRSIDEEDHGESVAVCPSEGERSGSAKEAQEEEDV